MAILRSIDDWAIGTELADYCFFCGKPLSMPVVYWAGQSANNPPRDGQDIFLHPECIETFCDRLMRDHAELDLGKEAADRILGEKKRNSRKP